MQTKRVKRVRRAGVLRVMPIYVLSDSATHNILPGSAIVGDYEYEVGRVTLDYEANRYGASNLTRFVERVHAAWDRHVTNYPTVSRIYAQSHEVTIVGEYDPMRKVVTINPFDLPKFEAWLGMSPVPEKELVF